MDDLGTDTGVEVDVGRQHTLLVSVHRPGHQVARGVDDAGPPLLAAVLEEVATLIARGDAIDHRRLDGATRVQHEALGAIGQRAARQQHEIAHPVLVTGEVVRPARNVDPGTEIVEGVGGQRVGVLAADQPADRSHTRREHPEYAGARVLPADRASAQELPALQRSV